MTNTMRDMRDMRDALAETLQKPLMDDEITASVKKKIENIGNDIADEIEYRLLTQLHETLAYKVAELAESAIEAMLSGNDSEFRRYIGADDYSARLDRTKFAGKVIHGKLFETGSASMRRKLVQAHADLLRTERMSDLEAHVEKLTAAVAKKDREIEELRGCRKCTPIYEEFPDDQ